jgi:hypothetical protein
VHIALRAPDLISDVLGSDFPTEYQVDIYFTTKSFETRREGVASKHQFYDETMEATGCEKGIGRKITAGPTHPTALEEPLQLTVKTDNRKRGATDDILGAFRGNVVEHVDEFSSGSILPADIYI